LHVRLPTLNVPVQVRQVCGTVILHLEHHPSARFIQLSNNRLPTIYCSWVHFGFCDQYGVRSGLGRASNPHDMLRSTIALQSWWCRSRHINCQMHKISVDSNVRFWRKADIGLTSAE